MIRWSTEPPAGDWVQVLAPKLNRSVQVMVAGPAVAVWTHWQKEESRSRPCMDAGCVFCPSQKPRLKGFLPAYTVNGRKYVVEVTAGLLRERPALMGRDFVGWQCRFERRGHRPNASVHLVLLDQVMAADRVVWFDVKVHLLRMWDLQQ